MAAVIGIPRRRLALLAILALAWMGTCGAFGGCNLFKPASPELPSTSVILGNYSDPESTLNSMVYGIRLRGQNGGADIYKAALAESLPSDPDSRAFRAFFDAVTASRHPTRPPEWKSDREMLFYQNYFVNQNTSSTLDLIWIKDETPGNDMIDPPYALLHKRYYVTVRTAGSTRIVGTGSANLEFIKRTDHWAVKNWQDRINPDSSTMAFGELRIGNQ